jgi:choline dehydrogenase
VTNTPRDFEFVIVGGGSAGAIVAARLAEDPANRVLVLEAGPENISYWSRVPLGLAKILDVEYGTCLTPSQRGDNW